MLKNTPRGFEFFRQSIQKQTEAGADMPGSNYQNNIFRTTNRRLGAIRRQKS
jgi:hypothetical protein